MTDKSARLFEIDNRIAAIRQEISDLTNRSSAVSGQASEDALAQQIEDRETQLAALQDMREALAETSE
ncbi:hypothetical protein [Phreatobacter stygius]|uniref:Uncharacterized protein n=1 Tax=Phreatobacter stygius TaxID=1940610 RepID=A0A4D7BE44_9HYPH|nr:hypothetical protein [Phreatobacter stygius]QCI68835.1 hypothetical protein E8M01_34160 [Phreatobacter stygius]